MKRTFVWKHSCIALHCLVMYRMVLCCVSVHSCQYPEPPVNGERTCHESQEGVHCVLTCHPGYAFVVEPPPEYFCAYDDVWTPADQLPFPDCAGQYTFTTFSRVVRLDT